MEILYEIAAHTIGAVTSGVSYVYGVHSAMGNNPLHTSGLESRFMGEVAHASEGITRADGIDLVRQLVSLYKDSQKNKLVGKPFNEIYKCEIIRPTTEWQEIYETVWEEVKTLGLGAL